MGLIVEIVKTIDGIALDYVQTVFTAVSTPVSNLLTAAAGVGVTYMALNQILQFRTLSISTFVFWVVRFLIISSFVLVWGNFKSVYDVFIAIPEDYSALLIKAVAAKLVVVSPDPTIIDPSVIAGKYATYHGMDECGGAIIRIAYKFLSDISFWSLGESIKNIFIGALVLVIGGVFLASSAITVIIAKVGFMMAASLAPLALAMLMLEQTRSHFEAWVRLTVSFLVLPILTAALMSVILYLAGMVLSAVPQNADPMLYFGFLFIMLATLFLLFQLPVMASTLAQASVAAGGASTLMAAASMAKRAPGKMMRGASSVKGAVGKANRAASFARDAVGNAKEAHDGGASKSRAAWAAVSGMRQSSVARNSRRDQRLQGRIDAAKSGKSYRGERAARKAQSPASADTSSSIDGSSRGQTGSQQDRSGGGNSPSGEPNGTRQYEAYRPGAGGGFDGGNSSSSGGQAGGRQNGSGSGAGRQGGGSNGGKASSSEGSDGGRQYKPYRPGANVSSDRGGANGGGNFPSGERNGTRQYEAYRPGAGGGFASGKASSSEGADGGRQYKPYRPGANVSSDTSGSSSPSSSSSGSISNLDPSQLAGGDAGKARNEKKKSGKDSERSSASTHTIQQFPTINGGSQQSQRSPGGTSDIVTQARRSRDKKREDQEQ